MRNFNGKNCWRQYLNQKMIRFKLDEDPLQRRIYFLTFIDSLNMIFSQYREAYEVLKDYPKMGGEM